MRKITKVIIFFLLALMLSCISKKDICSMTRFKELNILPVHSVLQLPEFKIIDSIRYDAQTILSYTIKSFDSLLSINCFVKNYENDPYAIFDIYRLKMFQKQEVEFNRNDLELLTDKISQINTIKVGYLKYLVQTPFEKFYEGRIFFYRDRKLVTLWLFEKYQNETQNRPLLMDCIFNNIKIN